MKGGWVPASPLHGSSTNFRACLSSVHGSRNFRSQGDEAEVMVEGKGLGDRRQFEGYVTVWVEQTHALQQNRKGKVETPPFCHKDYGFVIGYVM